MHRSITAPTCLVETIQKPATGNFQKCSLLNAVLQTEALINDSEDLGGSKLLMMLKGSEGSGSLLPWQTLKRTNGLGKDSKKNKK